MFLVAGGMLTTPKDEWDNPMGTGGVATGSNAIAGQHLPVQLIFQSKSFGLDFVIIVPKNYGSINCKKK